MVESGFAAVQLGWLAAAELAPVGAAAGNASVVVLAGAAADAIGTLGMREGMLFDIRAGLFAAAASVLSTLSDS